MSSAAENDEEMRGLVRIAATMSDWLLAAWVDDPEEAYDCCSRYSDADKQQEGNQKPSHAVGDGSVAGGSQTSDDREDVKAHVS